MAKYVLKIPHQDRHTKRRGARSQGLVEFALILPVLLLVIFVVIELARLLHAWLAIENGARFGVRYAVTGEYDAAYCLALPGACDPQSEEDLARVQSIKDVTNVGAVAILKNASVLNVGEPGFFKITVCSNKRKPGTTEPLFRYDSSDPNTPLAAECVEIDTELPLEDPGGPGDRVSVTVDFDHPLISPLISSVWPNLHLTARREGIVERYRTARVVGLPATISGPTATPTLTLTPSLTFTPSATATATFTHTPTPTPDCSELSITGMWTSGDQVRADVQNDSLSPAFLIDSYLEWPKLGPDMEVDYFEFNGQRYYTVDDPISPTSSTAPSIPLAGNGNIDRWAADFDGEPYRPIWGSYYLDLTFEFPGVDTCVLSRGYSRSQPPPPPTSTTRPSNTPGPSPTPTNTSKPSPSKTPTSTDPPGATPTDTDTPPEPTDTPPACVEC